MGWPYQQKPPMGWPLDYDSGLVPEAGFWPMLVGSGNTVQDLSGNGNTGIFVNSPSWVSGKFGSAVNFDSGDSAYIQGSLHNLTVPLTIITLFKTGAAGTARPFNIYEADAPTDSRYYALDAEIGVDFTYWARYDDANPAIVYTTETPSANTWYFLVAVSKSLSSHELYINGVFKASSVQAQPQSPVISNYGIGALVRTASAYADDTVSFCMAYNRALSASEIALLYREPFCMFKDPAEIALLAAYTAGAPPSVKPMWYYNEMMRRAS